MANSVDQDQTAHFLLYIIGQYVRLYLQQTTSADDIFRCIFSWRFKGYVFVFFILDYTDIIQLEFSRTFPRNPQSFFFINQPKHVVGTQKKCIQKQHVEFYFLIK